MATARESDAALTAYEQSKDVRRREPFLARQATTLLCRAYPVNAKRVRTLWEREVSTGLADSASVAVNLLHFAEISFPGKKDRAYRYLFPDKASGPYPVAKFLLLCLLATTARDKKVTVARTVVRERVNDPWMLNCIQRIHAPWFA